MRKLILILGVVFIGCSNQEEDCKMVTSITGNHAADLYSVSFDDGTTEINPEGKFKVGEVYCY